LPVDSTVRDDWLLLMTPRLVDVAAALLLPVRAVAPARASRRVHLTTSDKANFAWDDCPDNPRRAAIFIDPNHWGSNF
jgi:hypothetical protein